MLESLGRFAKLVDAKERRSFLGQQALVILMALFELMGVAVIGPFMAVVANPALITSNPILARIHLASRVQSPADFLVLMGVAVLAILGSSAWISVFTLWRNARFANQLGGRLTSTLYAYYLSQPWLFHSSRASSDLHTNLNNTDVITQSIVQPVLNIVARSVVVLFLAVPLLLLNPLVGLCGIALFAAVYAALYVNVRGRLLANGTLTSSLNYDRMKLVKESLGGIRDVLFAHRQDAFVRPYREKGVSIAHMTTVTYILGQFPRYLIEFVIYAAVISLILFLLRSHDGNLGAVFPILTVYAFAAFKVLPAIQSIYLSSTQIRSGMGAYSRAIDDLESSQAWASQQATSLEAAGRIVLDREIELHDVGFTYPSSAAPTLDGLQLTIPARKATALVGLSGSGKSTAIDILLGLISPSSGSIRIDGLELSPGNIRAWQKSIGLVSQSLFLADASIRRNVAFGIPDDAIDTDKVWRAIERAHLKEFVLALPGGLDTPVGERGVQLSGGQRQRIGIARALYGDPDVLVMDEATSSLDGISESIVMDAVHDFAGRKTVIMIAHRMSTIRECDCIYLIGSGRVLDHGTFEELLSRSPQFRQLAGSNAATG